MIIRVVLFLAHLNELLSLLRFSSSLSDNNVSFAENRYKHEMMVDGEPVIFEILDACPKVRVKRLLLLFLREAFDICCKRIFIRRRTVVVTGEGLIIILRRQIGLCLCPGRLTIYASHGFAWMERERFGKYHVSLVFNYGKRDHSERES